MKSPLSTNSPTGLLMIWFRRNLVARDVSIIYVSSLQWVRVHHLIKPLFHAYAPRGTISYIYPSCNTQQYALSAYTRNDSTSTGTGTGTGCNRCVSSYTCGTGSNYNRHNNRTEQMPSNPDNTRHCRGRSGEQCLK